MKISIMTDLKSLTYCLCLLILAEKAESCPKQNEDCIELSECEALFKLRNELPLTKSAAKLLRQAECSSEGSTTKVCCPKNGLVVEQTPIISIVNRFESNNDVTHSISQSNSCGIQFVVDKIYNGVVTELEEFPWMALLAYRAESGVIAVACGGTLINEKFVLTAAHCVLGPNVEKLGELIAVRLGEYDTQSQLDCDVEEEDYCAPPPIDVFIDSVHPHPNYTSETLNRHCDIALIKLKTEVKFTKFVQPICLPDDNLDALALSAKNRLTISGWGKTEKEDGGSGIKLKAKVPLVAEDECTATYLAKGINIVSTQICAGGGKHDSCEGDSGGPLMWEYKNQSRWYSIGIISYGSTPCAKPGVPAVYTRTVSHLDWILQIIKK